MFDLKKFLIDLIFPVQCLGCSQEGGWLCQGCLEKIKINFNNEACPVGGDLLGVWTVADYNQPLLMKILHSFKYNFIVDLGEILADLLIQFLASKIKEQKIPNFDLVIAVPLAKKRYLWRGFNQAEILAQKVSQQFGWRLSSDIIFRRYYNRPQVGLKAESRQSNVRGIFAVNNPLLLKNRKILLIDDVLTTGATIKECAKVLKNAGAGEVWGLAIAKG